MGIVLPGTMVGKRQRQAEQAVDLPRHGSDAAGCASALMITERAPTP